MLLKSSTFSFTGLLLICCIFFSCGDSREKEKQADQDPGSSALAETSTQAPAFDTQNLTVKTFEVKDSASGKSLGWGYDIYSDDHITIHQPIIPGIQGNQSFSTEEKAKITGALALSKMKLFGGLPTITLEELDSLGITK
ncbi:MAG TPA: DUF4907 domain-containing protein [Bacteroidia bacterium]|jgi:hypothetical protein